MNNVTLIGRLTRDPELRYVAGSQTAFTRFTVACDKRLSRQQREEFQRKNKPTADFISVKVWGKQAENCANYLKRGRKVAIQGSIETGSYEKDGRTIYTTDVRAYAVEFLEWDDNNAGNSNYSNNSNNNMNQGSSQVDDFKAVEDDDDIPF